VKGWTLQLFLMELRKLITYRADFWVNFFGQTIFSLVIAYFLWKSIFAGSEQAVMNGYSMKGMIFYYLLIPLIFRIQQGAGIGFLSREIYDGSLSKYLLYPINIFKFKATTYLANSFFYYLQLILILFLYNIIFFDPAIYQFSIFNFLLFTVVMCVSSVSFFYLYNIIEMQAFWFDNIWSLGVILRFGTAFLGGALIPLKFFPQWSQDLLTFTPFPYLIDFPMKTLKGELMLNDFGTNLVISIVWLLLFRIVAKFLWNKGKFAYSGVGI